MDLTLYGADSQRPLYQYYVREQVYYLVPFQRNQLKQTLGNLQGHSLLNRIEHEVAHCAQLDGMQVMQSVQMLRRFLNRIIVFRIPHRKVAVENLALREIALGRGGYANSILDCLIEVTTNASQRLKSILSQVQMTQVERAALNT